MRGHIKRCNHFNSKWTVTINPMVIISCTVGHSRLGTQNLNNIIVNNNTVGTISAVIVFLNRCGPSRLKEILLYLMDNLVSKYYYTAGVLFCMCTSQTVNPLPQIAAVVSSDSSS